MRKTKIVIPAIIIPDTMAASTVLTSDVFDLPEQRSEVVAFYTAVTGKLGATSVMSIDSGYRIPQAAASIGSADITSFTWSANDTFKVTFTGAGWRSTNKPNSYPLTELGQITVVLYNANATANIGALVAGINANLALNTIASGEYKGAPLSQFLVASNPVADRLKLSATDQYKGDGFDFTLALGTAGLITTNWKLTVAKFQGANYLWNNAIATGSILTTSTGFIVSATPDVGLGNVARVKFTNSSTICVTGQLGKINVAVYDADSTIAIGRSNKITANTFTTVPVLAQNSSANGAAVYIGEYNSNVRGVARYISNGSTYVTGAALTCKLQTAFGTLNPITYPVGGNFTNLSQVDTLLEAPASTDWVDATANSSAFAVTAGTFTVETPAATVKLGPWVRIVINTGATTTVTADAQMTGDIWAQ